MTECHQQLLRDLKCTVESLLISQVVNVWNVYGALNRLHKIVEKIFQHSSREAKENGSPDYWQFIQGLDWLQPDNGSTLFLDAEYRPYIPQHLKMSKASIWLYRNLESHSLSQKLSWLVSDKAHLASRYEEDAFLRQPKYAESALICLRAVERNQASLMSEIDPCLFLTKQTSYASTKVHKTHRRCSSYPDRATCGDRTEKQLETHQEIVQTKPESIEECTDGKIIDEQTKLSTSMPNLRIGIVRTRERSNTVAVRCSTTPSSPYNRSSLPPQDKLSPSVLKVDYAALEETSLKNKTKRVVIHDANVVVHTQPYDMRSNDTSFMSYGFSKLGHKDYKKHPKKSFIEDGGSSVLPMSTGYFPKPVKGQTLTSFLTSGQFARANAELDRENAHFSISEAIIAAIEQLKSERHSKVEECSSDEETSKLKQRIRMRPRQKQREKQRNLWTASFVSTSNRDTTTTDASCSPLTTSPGGSSSDTMSSDGVEDLDIDEDVSNLSASHKGLSMSMASLYSDADLGRRPRGAPDGQSDILSAEGVALSLISRFKEKQLPRASDLEWLVSEQDAPQSLLPLPKSWPVSADDSEEIPSTPLRGTCEWAPPRPQIIFTPHPSPSRKTLMAKQNYRCAGCGMRVASQYASKFRYCDYLGRYFCTGCHTNQLALIPGRVLHKWDFSRFPVSTFSYRLLDQMYSDPLFRALELNPALNKRSGNFDQCRKLRHGLYYLKDFILTCRFADNPKEILQQEPSYLLYDPEIYSMQDLFQIRNGEMISRLKILVEMCCRHTNECQLCMARGFICEICEHQKIIFPWQIRKVNRCNKCGACFHISCWNGQLKSCVKCNRIAARKESISSAQQDKIIVR